MSARDERNKALNEAAQKLGKARKENEANAAVLERQFSHQSMLAQDRYNYARDRRAEMIAYLDEEIRPLLPHPDAEACFNQVALLVGIYESTMRMMEIEIDCCSFNLELLENPYDMGGEDFRFPHKFLSFMEAKVKIDVALAWYYWSCLVDGIDTIMRAAMNESVIVVQSEEEEAERKARAMELRAAFKEDRDTGMLCGSLAANFKEAREIMNWALEAVLAMDTRNAQVKRDLLGDNRWPKLNGKIQTLLGEAHRRTHGNPHLSKLFDPLPEVQLPYATGNDTPATGSQLRAEAALAAARGGRADQPERPAAQAAPGARPAGASPVSGALDAMRAAMASATAAANARSTAEGAQPARPGLLGTRPGLPARPAQPQNPLGARPGLGQRPGLPGQPGAGLQRPVQPGQPQTGQLPQRPMQPQTGQLQQRLPVGQVPQRPLQPQTGQLPQRPLQPGQPQRPMQPATGPLQRPGLPARPGENPPQRPQ